MKRRAPRGFTLTELLIASTIIALFMMMVAWFAKGTALHRMSSERKLKLLERLQRVMFLIENDLLSARRHTIGNVLCNNIVFNLDGKTWRTTSDPGFDSEYTQLTNNINDRSQWFFPTSALVPVGTGAPLLQRGAFIDETPNGRLHGTGSLAIWSQLPVGTFYSVRSPDFSELKDQDYVLAGWVRGARDTNTASVLVPQIALQTSLGDGSVGNDIVSVADNPLNINFGQWTYLTARVQGQQLLGNLTYNIYLRTQVQNDNPTVVMTSSFDSLTLTPVSTIAQIDFINAQNVPGDSNVNLNNRNDLGMVFFKSDPLFGSLQEMKYIFADGEQHAFPANTPDLLRFSSFVPYFHSAWTVRWTNPDPKVEDPGEKPIRKESSLPNIRALSVNWVGPWQGGANRPLRVSVTVVDPNDLEKTLQLTRVLTPPTD